MKKSGFLEKQEAQKNELMHNTELLVKQFMVDTLCIAMNREGWGYDRIMRLLDEWLAVREEYRPALSPKDPECDVAQEHIDRELVRIINGKMDLIPFSERYPNLKRVSYEGEKTVKIGDKIRKPMSRADEDGKRRDQDKAWRFVKGQKKERMEKEGVVVYIHPKGRYYTLRFDFPNGSYRESFRI